MAPKAKKLTQIAIGDKYPVFKTVKEKKETADFITLTFDDGTTMEFDKSGDPAIMIEEVTP